MSSEEVFKKHFMSGMKNKDFESFKRAFPTLLKCIVSSIDEVKSTPEDQKRLAMNSWYLCMISMGSVPLNEDIYFEGRHRFMDMHGIDRVPDNLDCDEKFSDINMKNNEIRHKNNISRPSGD